MTRKKTKKEKLLNQLKRERAVRRQLEIDLGLPRVVGKVHKTHKRDIAEKQPNTIKEYDA